MTSVYRARSDVFVTSRGGMSIPTLVSAEVGAHRGPRRGPGPLVVQEGWRPAITHTLALAGASGLTADELSRISGAPWGTTLGWVRLLTFRGLVETAGTARRKKGTNKPSVVTKWRLRL